MRVLFSALTRQGAQIPLAIGSFSAALILILAAIFLGGMVDRPVAFAIAAALVLNGCARLVLWRNRAHW